MEVMFIWVVCGCLSSCMLWKVPLWVRLGVPIVLVHIHLVFFQVGLLVIHHILEATRLPKIDCLWMSWSLLSSNHFYFYSRAPILIRLIISRISSCFKRVLSKLLTAIIEVGAGT